MDSETIIISKEEAGIRIDKVLSDRFDAKSRTYFQYLIGEGLVSLNGNKVKKRALAKEGDEIEVFFQLTPQISIKAENIPLDILYEDKDIIAVNKPAGMVVHPAPGHYNQTFVNALLYHCKDAIFIDESIRPGIVHRLDKDTTGVLLAAKTREAHEKLIAAFSQRRIHKQYLAICLGKPKQGILSAPIGRHPQRRKEMAVRDHNSKEAVSDIKVLAFNEKRSFILVEPKTGRTHQIRVHLKYLNCPIVGDELYGKADSSANRQLLHAYRIKFNHPITRESIEITAPIPQDIKRNIAEFSNPCSSLAINSAS